MKKELLVKGLDAKHQAQSNRGRQGPPLCSSLTLPPKHTSVLAQEWPSARCSLHVSRFSCVSQMNPAQNEHCDAGFFRAF